MKMAKFSASRKSENIIYKIKKMWDIFRLHIEITHYFGRPLYNQIKSFEKLTGAIFTPKNAFFTPKKTHFLRQKPLFTTQLLLRQKMNFLRQKTFFTPKLFTPKCFLRQKTPEIFYNWIFATTKPSIPRKFYSQMLPNK